MQSSSRFGIFIFSSGSGCWSTSTSISWGDLGLGEIEMLISRQCTYDCFFWKVREMSMLLKLDMNTMQFCTIDLPHDHGMRQIVIVDSGESRFAMFSMIYDGTSVDYYTFSQNGSDKSHEWHLKSTIPLPAHYTTECFIGSAAEGYVFIECNRDERIQHIQQFFRLRLSLSILRRSVGAVSLLMPVHILVSHHLCHQGGFKGMERVDSICSGLLVLLVREIVVDLCLDTQKFSLVM